MIVMIPFTSIEIVRKRYTISDKSWIRRSGIILMAALLLIAKKIRPSVSLSVGGGFQNYLVRQRQQQQQYVLRRDLLLLTSPSSLLRTTDGFRIRPNLAFSPKLSSKSIIIQSSSSLFSSSSSSSQKTTTAIDTTANNNNNNNSKRLDPILKDLNVNQIAAVTQPLDSITRVVAGPGSGKTRVLTSRIVHILQQDPNYRNQKLAVTFTRKAATEMQNRVEKLLQAQNQQNQGGMIHEENYGNDNNNNNNNVPPTDPSSDMKRVSLGTFHSICAKLLRWNGHLLHTLPSIRSDMSNADGTTGNGIVLDKSFNIIDQDEQVRTIKEILKEKNIDLTSYDLKVNDIINGINKYKHAIVMKGINPFADGDDIDVNTLRPKEEIIQRIYYPYREKLITSNCIDFDDLIYYTRELLLVNPIVRRQIQQRYKYILVDEYQDTSQSQIDLIKLLSSTSLLIVGDADQSIYSWRGAYANSMSNFENDYNTPVTLAGISSNDEHNTAAKQITTIYLMENYRSTSNIVKAAQKVIADSGKSTGNHELRRKMVPQRSKGPTPRIVACNDAKAEAEYIVRQVKERIKSGELDTDHSVAFIYRTNAQSRALEEACVIQNVPFRLFGTATSFYKRLEIKDCLCYLRWIYNGRDRSSMIRAMKTPRKSIGDVAISEFDQYCMILDDHWAEHAPGQVKPTQLEVLYHMSGDDSWCPIENMEFPPLSISFSGRSLKPLVAFSKQMCKVRKFASKAAVEELLSYIITEMELIEHYDKVSKSKAEFAERKENIQELRLAAERYNQDGPCLVETIPDDSNNSDGDDEETGPVNEFTLSPLGKFLDDVTLVADMVDNAEAAAEKEKFAVNLMTIHGSKGMEFDSVFFVGLEDGTLPTSQALDQGPDSVVYEEEKRLCYVAMTRAKTDLVMTWRREVSVFTSNGIKTFTRSRSRFLDVLVEKSEKDEKTSSNKPTSKANLPWPQSRGLSTASGFPYNQDKIQPTMPSNKFKGGTTRFYDRQGQPAEKKIGDVRSLTKSGKPVSSPTQRLGGTSSVYGKQRFPLEVPLSPKSATKSPNYKATAKGTSYNQRADMVQNRFAKAGIRAETNVRTNPLSQVQKKPGSDDIRSIRTKTVARESKKSSKSELKADASWFYPVGSSVTHKTLGKGIVLAPKSISTTNDVMLVHIKFSSRKSCEFPANSADLSPIVF